VMGELFAALNRDNLAIGASPIKAEDLGRLVERVTDGTLSGKLGKQVFQSMWTSGRDADAIIEAEGLRQVSDTTLIEVAVREVLAANAEQVEQFRAGKDKVLGFLVGQVMKKTGGKANPALVNELIRTEIAR
jgi:aspartyl-tRNA(Asn)/glutamyl-tRNA(Gln) amidotransferase subunit B